MSGEVVKTETTLTGPQLIDEAKLLFKEVLANFRECHVLCVKSGLFSSKVILEIDTCAVSFRQMCLDTVTIARVVSDQWLRSTIMFFKNISRVKDPKKMMILLGNQAKEIGILFKVIGAWARDLAGRFHEAQQGTITEVEEFRKVFEEAVKSAEEVKQRAQEQIDAAETHRKEAQAYQDKWRTAQIAVSWIPFGAAVTAIGSSVAASKTAEAEKIEQEANRKLRQAEAELQKRNDENEKAQYIASKAGDLVNLLNQVEKTCEALATFWTLQSNKFITQGQTMKTNDAEAVECMPEVVAEDNVKVWTEAKTDLTLYADAVTVIGNCFNFVTDAKPPSATRYTVPNLDFTLHIPSTVDVKAIEKSVEKKQIGN